MSNANYARFSKRLHRIDRDHRKLSRGYVRLVERDGILVPAPERAGGFRFPYRGLLFAAIGLLLFKAVLFAGLGEGTYNFRVNEVANGTGFEQVVAWVMQADPITIWLAGFAAPLL